MEVKKIFKKTAWVVLFVFVALLISAINIFIALGLDGQHIPDWIGFALIPFLVIMISQLLIRPLLIRITTSFAVSIFLRIFFIIICAVISFSPYWIFFFMNPF